MYELEEGVVESFEDCNAKDRTDEKRPTQAFIQPRYTGQSIRISLLYKQLFPYSAVLCIGHILNFIYFFLRTGISQSKASPTACQKEGLQDPEPFSDSGEHEADHKQALLCLKILG